MPQGSVNPYVIGSFCEKETTLAGTFTVSNRFVKAICARLSSVDSSNEYNCELDSHADTVCAGKEFVMFEQPDRFVNVHAFSEEYQPLKDILLLQLLLFGRLTMGSDTSCCSTKCYSLGTDSTSR